MSAYVNYEGKKISFTLPKGWNVISGEDKPPVPGVADPIKEIQRVFRAFCGAVNISLCRNRRCVREQSVTF